MSLSAPDLDYVRDLVRARSAIVLNDKAYLIETRLQPVARQRGFGGISELVEQLRRTPRGPLHDVVVDAMTTNETSFFRDPNLWSGLREHLLPQLIDARRQTRALTLWSAACSSGQEPYSLAMMLLDDLPQLRDWNVRILSSDLSAEMLGRAAAGRYSQLEVNRGLPAPTLIKHFTRDGTMWQISDRVRQMVEFRTINLSEPWPLLPPIDLLLCRNVLIYFDLPTKQQILTRCRQVMRPDGYLVLGGSETTFNIDDSYERVTAGATTAYRPR